MRLSRQRHKKGSVRKVPRAHGFAWAFRYHYTDDDGKYREKVPTPGSAAYETEFDVREAMESQMSSLNERTLSGKIFEALVGVNRLRR